jgi:large subunit ribosomal protein L13
VINAHEVRFSSNSKEADKKYYDYSGWVGGMKIRTVKQMKEKYPERILERAVAGMLPHGPLGRRQIKKLKIYAADKHPHAAQNPVVWEGK